MPRTAIVIGAGIAGLATAARLAAKGIQVAVYEKNSYAGGKLGVWEDAGYRFDTGPSLFTQPHILEQLFADCSRALADFLTYHIAPEGTRYFYPDGTCLQAYQDHAQLATEIRNVLDTDPQPVLDFLQEARDAYKHIGGIFLNKPLGKLTTWLNADVLKALHYLKPAYLLHTMHAYHTQRLSHPKLVQLFDRFATYNGSNPYQAPAMLSMIAHLEMNEGCYYPQGGMYAIAQAMYELCLSLGVEFQFNTDVTRIVREGKKVTGIIANDETRQADIVVSNSDVYFTYANLLGDDKAAAKLRQQERSSSAVIFYWGIRKTFPELGLYNIFFSEDHRAEFDSIFRNKAPYPDPTIYLNITCKKEATHTPAGCENWFVLVNTPAQESWQQEDSIATIRANVLQKLSNALGVDIEPLIVTEKTLTPQGIASDTGSYMGALYGTASNDRMAAFARHGQINMRYRNLYFAGGTVHPGGGIPLCLRSAKLAADAILYK